MGAAKVLHLKKTTQKLQAQKVSKGGKGKGSVVSGGAAEKCSARDLKGGGKEDTNAKKVSDPSGPWSALHWSLHSTRKLSQAGRSQEVAHTRRTLASSTKTQIKSLKGEDIVLDRRKVLFFMVMVRRGNWGEDCQAR